MKIASVHERRGTVLIIVLLCIALLAAVVVGYFDSMKTAVSTSSAFKANADAKRAADSAVALVTSQIQAATSCGTTNAWASQPGALRTWDSNGNPVSVYKLYSSPQMIVSGSAFNPTNDIPPGTWTNTPGLYVDLNEPVQTNYPIVNPAAATLINTNTLVDGFSIDTTAAAVAGATNQAAMPVQWVYQLKDGTLVVPTSANGTRTTIPQATTSNPPIARFAFWTDDETCKLNINTASEGSYWDVPMFANPAEFYFARYQPATHEYQRYPGHPATTSLSPVLWNFFSLPDPNYSLLPSLNPQTRSSGSSLYLTTEKDVLPTLSNTAQTYFPQIFQMAPRVVYGGSQMGSVATVASSSIAISAVDSDRLYASGDELLFSSTGMTGGTRNLNTPLTQDAITKMRFFLTTESRAPEVNMFNQPKITMWPINDPTKANPGNPYNTTTNTQSPLDQLIAFCSTLNGDAYYFTRNSPLSTAGDFTGRNVILYNYIRSLLGVNIPGFGASFTSRYGNPGCDEITTLFYDFIRSNINLVDSSSAATSFSGAAAVSAAQLQYAFAPGQNGAFRLGCGQVVPFIHPSNGTRGMGRFVTLRQCALWFIARAANQPPGSPLHPYISLGVPYPTISGTNNDPAQTHAGMPYLTTLDPVTNQYDLINPRYPGPQSKWGASSPAIFPDLAAGQTQIYAAFVCEMVNNSVGNVGISPSYKLRIRGLNAFTASGTSLGFTSSGTQTNDNLPNGGPSYQYALGTDLTYRRITGGVDGATSNPLLSFTGSPVVVSGTTFAFGGGTVEIDILDTAGEVVQTLNVKFPNANFPTPMLPTREPDYFATTGTIAYPPKIPTDLVPTTLLTFDSGDQLAANPNFGTGTTAYFSSGTKATYNTGLSRLVYPDASDRPDPNGGPGKNLFLPQITVDPATDTSGLSKYTCDTIRSVECAYGDTRLIAAMTNVPTNFFTPHADYFSTTIRSAHTMRGDGGIDGQTRGGTVQPLTDASWTFSATLSNYYAINWGLPVSGSSAMQNRPAARVDGSYGNTSVFPETTSGVNFTDPTFTSVWASGGDFDNGLAVHSDGPYINKPDEGTVLYQASNTTFANPYFDSFSSAYNPIGSSLFSPNRQVSSPVVFGSLPSGISPSSTSATGAWRTFLFCPNPNSQTQASLGANPPDYALLDFFYMPVVEPYAISEALSTAGKVNMNYQILPFTYIHRDTALRGVFKSVMITAVPDSMRYYYKALFKYVNNADLFGDAGGPMDTAAKAGGYWNYRYPIHAGETLKQFDAKFATGAIFHSPSEICSLWLYPATQPTPSNPTAPATPVVTYDSASANIKSWWYSGSGTTRKSLTGTNLRDRPYSLLYPRLTTKSNTYTVHVRGQTLGGAISASGTLDENSHPVTGEWRGSFLIERYINPNDTSLPDFAATQNASTAVDSYYKFHTVSTKQFSP